MVQKPPRHSRGLPYRCMIRCTDSVRPFCVGHLVDDASPSRSHPLLKATVRVTADSFHLPHFEIHFVVNVFENNHWLERHMWYRLVRDNIQEEIAIAETVTPQSIAAFEETYQDWSHIDTAATYEWLQKRDQHLWHATVTHKPGPLYANSLFTEAKYGEPVDTELDTFRDLLTDGNTHNFELVVAGYSMDQDIRRLHEDFMAQETSGSPLDSFYCGTSRNTEMDQFNPAAKRPNYSLDAPLSYQHWLEYCTVQAVGAIQEDEYLTQRDKQHAQIPMVVLRPYRKNGNVYLGFIKKTDLLNEGVRRIRMDDRVTIHFSGLHIQDMCGRVTSPFVHSAAGDVTVLFSRARDADADTDEEEFTGAKLDSRVIECNTTDAARVRAAIAKAKPFDVRISVVTSDTVFKRRLSSMSTLQRFASGDTKQLLLANSFRKTELKQSDMFSTISESDMDKFTEEYLGFNKGQMSAFEFMRQLPARVGLVAGPPGTGKTFLITLLTLTFIITTPSTSPIVEAWRPECSLEEAETHDEEASGSHSALQFELEFNDLFVNQASITEEPPANDQCEPDLGPTKDSHLEINAGSAPRRKIASPPKKHKVLLVAPINSAVDRLVESITNEVVKHDSELEERPVIIRFHAWASEQAVVQHRAKKDHQERIHGTLSGFHESTAPIIGEMSDAVRHVRAATAVRHGGVSDKRVVHLSESLGAWMLTFAGYHGPNAHRCTDKVRFQDTLEMITRRIRDDIEDWTEAQQDEFSARLEVLREYTFRCADVVITTLSNAADSMLHSAFAAVHIFCDEAGKAPEADFWSLLAYYPYARGIILVGDSRQLGPFEEEDSDQGFRSVLGLSLYTRLERSGFPVASLTEQHRAVPELNDLVSTLFYESRLTTSPDVSYRPKSGLVKKFNETVYGKSNSLVFINTSNSQAGITDRSCSKSNQVNVAVVMELLEKLLQCEATWVHQNERNTLHLSATDIVVLTPYQAQHDQYRKAICLLAKKHPDHDLNKLAVKTFDDFQGGERSVAIVDFVVCETPGFLREEKRSVVGLSRGRDAMYIVGNIPAWQKDYRGSSQILRRLAEFCYKKDVVVADKRNPKIVPAHTRFR